MESGSSGTWNQRGLYYKHSCYTRLDTPLPLKLLVWKDVLISLPNTERSNEYINTCYPCKNNIQLTRLLKIL